MGQRGIDYDDNSREKNSNSCESKSKQLLKTSEHYGLFIKMNVVKTFVGLRNLWCIVKAGHKISWIIRIFGLFAHLSPLLAW